MFLVSVPGDRRRIVSRTALAVAVAIVHNDREGSVSGRYVNCH